TIHVPLPDRAERLRFIAAHRANEPADRLADTTSGLSLVNLNVLLATSKTEGETGEAKRFGQLKKALIERQCQGLVEFVEPKHTLDLVVGHAAACERLVQDARWIGQGRFDAAPMGYLITGPVGTGKTFLAECYAGSIGIPCVKLRNFRSKYVGETEGNLEQVLTVLRSLGPVVVIIDEADAALGSRQAEGDSGTSSRVFSMIASQMGDTSYRGKIVWMLLTSRPDLLPIDLKRQGRAEVHIPLFYPQDDAEVTAMFAAMARKSRISLAADALTGLISPKDAHLSGADIESVMLAARRIGLTAGRDDVRQADLRQALGEFIPSAQGLEKEMQELAAVLECTQQSFLTPAWRTKTAEAGGRARLQERLAAIRQLLEE
ncbi:MAG: ATP-binding protein, partial [Candidatus Saccharimonadales bacterium]